MRSILIALALVFLCTPGFAQTGAPTSWTLRIYTQGASTPQSTLAGVQMQCGQAKATGPTLNPTTWRIDDPADAAKDCVFADAARLTALADGNYEGTVSATNADGTSGESSPRSPFTRKRPNPPAVPTGVRVTQ